MNRYSINDTIYVADPELCVWGSGKTEQAAIDDCKTNLIDKYETLVENKNRLTKLAEKRLSELRAFLRRVA